jgi:glucose/arabinose dehydrogenase
VRYYKPKRTPLKTIYVTEKQGHTFLSVSVLYLQNIAWFGSSNKGITLKQPQNPSIMNDILTQMKAESAYGAAAQLRKTINTTAPSRTVAGVNTGNVSQVYLGDMDPITIQHTSASGAAEIIKIGDLYGVIAKANNIATQTEYSDTTASTWTAAQLASLCEKGILVAQINYVVDNNSQFANPFRYATTDSSGANGGRDIKGRFSASQRSTDQNLLVKTLDLSQNGKQLLLDPFNALFITVAAGRTVTLTLTYGSVVQ